jgi:hypothetical protein
LNVGVLCEIRKASRAARDIAAGTHVAPDYVRRREEEN